MQINLTEEEISNLIVRVTRRISRLELWLYQDKFNNTSKYANELEILRKLKPKLVAALTQELKNE